MNMIDSMFMSHQNASKQFERCFSVDFWQNELESLVMAEILDIFKGFPTLFTFSLIWREKKNIGWKSWPSQEILICHDFSFITSKQIKLESPWKVLLHLKLKKISRAFQRSYNFQCFLTPRASYDAKRFVSFCIFLFSIDLAIFPWHTLWFFICEKSESMITKTGVDKMAANLLQWRKISGDLDQREPSNEGL